LFVCLAKEFLPAQGLDRAEALALVEQVIEHHEDLAEASDDLLSAAANNRDRSRAVLDTLRAAGWFQEEERSDWHKLVFFDPNGMVLLQALRRMAYPEAAIFSDKRGERGIELTMQIGTTSSAFTMNTVARGCFVRQREMQSARPLGSIERRHY
jgi:hypothetical protein